MPLDIMAILLTQGLYALVDGKDYGWLNQWKWCAQKSRNTYYACRNIKCNKQQTKVSMYRQILGFPTGKQCDHINNCGLDNRRQNLRVCNQAQNYHNQVRRKGYTSQFRGVHWEKRKRKWQVQICHNYKHYYLGFFCDEIEAAKAYDKKAQELFGEFANTNFSSPFLLYEVRE